ncbi:hypothetical protein HPB51_022988 [Rhipicephalus microplus]|uniref:Tick transposon n=1 Tax=Rhipicephalus microplus TaxID=6941 RepID=A0A9J6DCR0_RHIMP|nr:hypothetical protein HPB51_022988 [Rhipicephalus microplus]
MQPPQPGFDPQSKREKALAKILEDYEMALLNEPDVTTTRSNGAARDTMPDLTWSFGPLDVTRKNEDGRLGSDYSVIGRMITGSRYQAVLGKARITDWDKIAKHAAALCRKNWLKTCDGLQDKLSARKTWCLLRHLTDPLSSKIATDRNRAKVLSMFKGDGHRLLEVLKAKYLKTEKDQYLVLERLGDRGTPEGLVLSCLLFNLALLLLPDLLKKIEVVERAFNTDNITLWTA